MESLYILIPVAVIFVCVALAVFYWAVKSDQYDDLSTEARRILFDQSTSSDRVHKQAAEPVNQEKH